MSYSSSPNRSPGSERPGGLPDAAVTAVRAGEQLIAESLKLVGYNGVTSRAGMAPLRPAPASFDPSGPLIALMDAAASTLAALASAASAVVGDLARASGRATGQPNAAASERLAPTETGALSYQPSRAAPVALLSASTIVGGVAVVDLAITNELVSAYPHVEVTVSDLMSHGGHRIASHEVRVEPRTYSFAAGETARFRIIVHAHEGTTPGTYAGVVGVEGQPDVRAVLQVRVDD